MFPYSVLHFPRADCFSIFTVRELENTIDEKNEFI